MYLARVVVSMRCSGNPRAARSGKARARGVDSLARTSGQGPCGDVGNGDHERGGSEAWQVTEGLTGTGSNLDHVWLLPLSYKDSRSRRMHAPRAYSECLAR